MPPNDLPPHTSASQLGCYAGCPRKYACRYVERRDPEYRGTGLALGSAVHGAVAWWFDERAAEREPTVEAAVKVLRADLAAALAYDNVRWNGTTAEKLAADAERLVGFFLAEHGELAVNETEVPFDFTIVDPDTGEQMPHPLVGFFDLELAAGNLVELKTCKRAYSPTDLRTNLQFSAYRTAARYYGVDVELIALVRTKTPKLQHVVLPHDADISEWFMRAAASIERAIAAGHFPPAPSAMCGGCEYQRACLGVTVETADAEAEAA